MQDKKGDKGLIEYIKSELNVDNKIAINLVEMIGNNVLKLKNEIEKLKNYFYKQEFNLEKAKKQILHSVHIEPLEYFLENVSKERAMEVINVDTRDYFYVEDNYIIERSPA